MVKFSMDHDQSIHTGLTRAKELFFKVIEDSVSDGDEPEIDFIDFKILIKEILNESNGEASKRGKPKIPIPSDKDLLVLFGRADVDKSGLVDEFEFIGLYGQVMEGNVKGLGDSAFTFYIRPHQLMQFGQHEHHPDTDWQDLFFDLLFVGGAYQTGNFLAAALIDGDEAWEGMFWSFGIFICLAQQWFMKMLISARFGCSSMFHYFLDHIEFVVLALAMWHIPAYNVTIERNGDDSSSYSAYGSSYSGYGSSYSAYSAYTAYSRRLAGSTYSASSGNSDVYTPLEQIKYNINDASFGFFLCLVINNIIYIFKWMEIVTDEHATKGARSISAHLARTYVATFIVYSIGAILAKTNYDNSDPDHNNVTKYTIYLCLLGTMCYIASFNYWIWFLHQRKKEGVVADHTVPMNVSYVIHRIGEFCMLMIGETVLSLLVVDETPQVKNYLMFIAGMFFAGNLHFQHFSTYPSDPAEHVLRKGTFDSSSSGYMFCMVCSVCVRFICILFV